jgi:methionyl-tRNA formyltransferase
MKKTKIIFLGTPNFAIPFLKSLINESSFDIASVITEPNRRSGRGKQLKESQVAQYVNKLNSSQIRSNKKILLFKPIKTYDIKSKILNLKPDIAVVVAYGQIIPDEILDIPRYGSINIHPSDLPKYRGPSPIQSALLNGDKNTKVTIMKMDAKMDHGSILDKLNIDIDENDDYSTLEKKILTQSPKFLIKTLKKYISNKIKPKKQDHKMATFCKLINKKDGLIDWNKSPKEIHNQIRAYAVWPKAYTTITNNKRLIFLKSKIVSGKLKPILVQLEGRKQMSWRQFTNGYQSKLPQSLTKVLL